MPSPGGGIRLTVLDDGSFVHTQVDDIRPLSATFNRFVEAVARAGAFERVRYLVPVRELRVWEVEPALAPIDESVLEVVPTTFFSGIADYVARAGWVAGTNWPVIERAVVDSDLLWLRLPASNALLALAAARRHRVAHFGWVAGSAAAVAGAQRRPLPLRWGAQAIGAAYDAVTALAGESGPLLTLDADIFASVVTAAEVEQTRRQGAGAREGPLTIAWSGRMAGEKGLAQLVDAFGRLLAAGRDVRLVLIGDGPARPRLEQALAGLPADRIDDYGYVGDRPTYMSLLRSAHLFVHPSAAEGVPKVLVEAMAAGVPIVASDAGAVAGVVAHGDRGRLVAAGDVDALTDALAALLDDPAERDRLRQRGLNWAADHTAEAQAERLVSWLRPRFPDLAWPS